MSDSSVSHLSLVPQTTTQTPQENGQPMGTCDKSYDSQQVCDSLNGTEASRANQPKERGRLHNRVFHSYPTKDKRGRVLSARVTTALFNGRWYLNFRKFYQDASGEWMPSNEGVNVPMREVAAWVGGAVEALEVLRAAGIPLDGNA